MPNVFINGICILFIITGTTSTTPTDSPCASQTPGSNLNVYFQIQTPIVDTTIYSCRYNFIENICNNAPCPNCPLEDQQTYPKRVNNHWKMNSTTVEILDDMIVLQSGYKCRYSTGSCHDEKNKTKFVWAVTNCYWRKVLKVDVSAHFVIINHRKYAVVPAPDGYAFLELRNRKPFCGYITWESDGFLVSDKPILPRRAFSRSQQVTIAQFVSEIKKRNTSNSELQELYNALLANCAADFENKNTPEAENSTPTSVENLSVASGVFHLSLLDYLTIVNTICMVCILLYFVCSKLKKVSCVVNCSVASDKLYDTV